MTRLNSATMADKGLRWGVLGVASIAVNYVVPAIGRVERARCLGIASRDLVKARRAASRLGIDRAYGSYEALLEDDEIDAVYLPLPNALHAAWSVRALEAGKAVLCEKPLATGAAEVEAIAKAAATAQQPAAEALMYRHHPQFGRLLEVVEAGAIGEPRLVRGSIGMMLAPGPDIRADPSLGGGALADLGCYVCDAACAVFDSDPIEAAAILDRVEGTVDDHDAAVLVFPGGRLAVADASFRLPWFRSVLEVHGAEGVCRLEHAFNPGQGETSIRLDRLGQASEVIQTGSCDMYAAMVRSFGRAVLDGASPHPSLASSARTARALDLIRSSATARA
ncbi:MAG TPA: Gfo/Idh/MocA family oxidoreductase [Streptosporangiaceae bacterium]|nr:Gfo/Idh/MocA family oxidoreductase [Streptosporangiaceae bacterium]